MKHYTYITTSTQGTQRVTTAGEHVFFFHNLSLDLDIDIAHPEAKVSIYGLYTAKGNEKYTLTTHQRHTVPGGYSDLLVKGVFDDASALDYAGYIKIDVDCNGSHAYQKNQNLLLSRRARVTSEPNLEILSPDVFCTHGSTTGKVNPEHLMYMQTRGVNSADAVRLYVDGFIQDLVSKLADKVPEFELR